LSLNREVVLGLPRDSLDVFALEIGRRVAVGLLEDEVEELCGPRHEWGLEGRTATRYGRQPGYICVGGQKTRIERPRVRSVAGSGGELALGCYGQLRLHAPPLVQRWPRPRRNQVPPRQGYRQLPHLIAALEQHQLGPKTNAG
jgi:hypothetical protein